MKWIGMSLIFIGCVGMGLWYRSSYIRKWKNLVEIKKSLVILKGEISYGRTPLPDAFFRMANKTKGVVSAFYRSLAEGLEEGKGDMELLWKHFLEQCISEGEMRVNDRKELEQLGSTLGYLDADMQLQTLGLYERQLEQSIHFYERESENRTRLYPILGTIGGILICIIMI